MTNSTDDAAGESGNSSDRHELLKKLVEERETEENLQKLGQTLAKEWKTTEPDPQPDLSFEKFKRKLSERQ